MPFFNVEEGLARQAVKKKNIARLRYLPHRVKLLTVAGDRDQVRIDR